MYLEEDCRDGFHVLLTIAQRGLTLEIGLCTRETHGTEESKVLLQSVIVVGDS
jgi:hypothetical protein